MKKNHGLAISALALTLAAAPAIAQEDAGVYLGASLGTGTASNSCLGITGNCDDTDTAYRLFGGYQVNRNFAWEVGYGYLGDVTVNGTDGGGGAVNFESTRKALDFSGVVMLPMTERFSLFGRLGIYRSQTERRGTGVTTGGDHNTSFTWGLGGMIHFGRALAVRAEWQQYPDIGGDSSAVDDVDLLTLGLVMRF